jgi:glycosyltransferase involved in cell wall biosynthesis
MKVQYVFMTDLNAWDNFRNSECYLDNIEFNINRQWNKGNKMVVFRYNKNEIDAVIRRGINSGIRTDIPVGNLLTTGIKEGKLYIWDDAFWSYRMGKSCMFTDDTPSYMCWLQGTRDKIHPINWENQLLTKISLRNVLKRLYDIDIELYSDADVLLLPSRSKFSCGFGRTLYLDEQTHDHRPTARYEAGWISFIIDHDLFSSILPSWEYNRENSSDPNHAGINGVINEFPQVDRETVMNAWFMEIATMVEEEPKVEMLEPKYL